MNNGQGKNLRSEKNRNPAEGLYCSTAEVRKRKKWISDDKSHNPYGTWTQWQYQRECSIYTLAQKPVRPAQLLWKRSTSRLTVTLCCFVLNRIKQLLVESNCTHGCVAITTFSAVRSRYIWFYKQYSTTSSSIHHPHLPVLKQVLYIRSHFKLIFT